MRGAVLEPRLLPAPRALLPHVLRQHVQQRRGRGPARQPDEVALRFPLAPGPAGAAAITGRCRLPLQRLEPFDGFAGDVVCEAGPTRMVSGYYE